MKNFSVRYARPMDVGTYRTHGSIAVWDDEDNIVLAQFVYSWISPRAAYRQMDIIARLLNQGRSLADAEMIAENWTNPPHELTRKFTGKCNYAPSERPGLYPIRENECDETNPEIINDWLTDAYAAEFGLECGDEVNDTDLYTFFLRNYVDDMPVPHYLEHEARLWDGIEAFVTSDEDFDGWENSHHLEPTSY